jgi:TolB protein
MDIYTMTEDGSDVYRVTTAAELEFDSSWMVEGELLLFDSFRNGNWDIFVVEPSGAATGRLTSHPADDESPVWRPLP